MTPERATSPAPTSPAGSPETIPPAFAVVMTVKNGMPWIEEAMRSVLPALEPGGEVVVVDAASTDGTTEFLRGLSARAPLRLVVQPCSMGVGRNRGIEESGAPVVITQVDADTRYHAEAFRTGVQVLKGRPGTGLVLVIGREDELPDATKLYVWDRAFFLSTPRYPDTNVGDDMAAVRQALERGKVRRVLVDHVGEDLRTQTRGYEPVRQPWKKGPGFLRLSRRRYTQGWTWWTYTRFLWVTRRTLVRCLAGIALATVARLAPAP